MNIGIRSPAEVIALAIEDAGIVPDQAKTIAEDAAKRLARCFQRLSRPGAVIVIHSSEPNVIAWGTVHSPCPDNHPDPDREATHAD